jgi:hypothetical protein
VAGALLESQGVTDEYIVPTVNAPDTMSTVSSVASVTYRAPCLLVTQALSSTNGRRPGASGSGERPGHRQYARARRGGGEHPGAALAFWGFHKGSYYAAPVTADVIRPGAEVNGRHLVTVY